MQNYFLSISRNHAITKALLNVENCNNHIKTSIVKKTGKKHDLKVFSN